VMGLKLSTQPPASTPEMMEAAEISTPRISTPSERRWRCPPGVPPSAGATGWCWR
jgi:hypothetical protein